MSSLEVEELEDWRREDSEVPERGAGEGAGAGAVLEGEMAGGGRGGSLRTRQGHGEEDLLLEREGDGVRRLGGLFNVHLVRGLLLTFQPLSDWPDQAPLDVEYDQRGEKDE